MPVGSTRSRPNKSVSPLIGAEIVGVDFAQPVDKATAEALREAFWTYKVLPWRTRSSRFRPG
jgi:alpha-ketoglutarate-dependent taurine dioxygenase